MRRKSRNKKGISPLVAKILLVGLVAALVIIVIAWGRTYIEELMEKRGVLSRKELECGKIELFVQKANHTGNYIGMVIENKKDIDISTFMFNVKGDKGTETIKMQPMLKGMESAEFALVYDREKVGVAEKVDAVPWLKVVGRKMVPCSNKVVSIKLT